MKTTVAVWKEYLAVEWPADHYVDDDLVTVNGNEDADLWCPLNVENLDPTAPVVIVAGNIYKDKNPGYEIVCSLKHSFREFLRRRDTVTFVIEVPKERKLDFLAAVSTGFGAKIVSNQ